MNRRQLLIGLSTGAVVGLAGCSDNTGSGGGGVVTDDENGSDDGLTEVEVEEYPPGLSESSIDGNVVVENSQLFTDLLSVRYEARELFGDIEAEDQYRDITADVDIETATVHKIEESFDGVKQEQYKVGSRLYNRIVDGEDEVRNEVITQVPDQYAFQPILDTGYARVTELIRLMSISGSTVYENSDGEKIYEYRADDTPEGDFETVEFSVRIHEDMIFQDLHLTLETETDGYSFNIEFSGYGETSVAEPEWSTESEEVDQDEISEEDIPDGEPGG